MTELLLIRHGETSWNVEGKYTGQTDVPLNSTGERQATLMAKEFQNSPIEAIYSSDLIRAQRTAEVLSDKTGASLTIDPRLREINQGTWEGMHFSEIQKRFKGTLEKRRRNPLQVTPPKGESLAEVRERVLKAYQTILETHPDDLVAIVAHGIVLAIIKVHMQNLPFEVIWDHIPENAQPELYKVEGR
jgi:alpha-ribazole phosphatase